MPCYHAKPICMSVLVSIFSYYCVLPLATLTNGYGVGAGFLKEGKQVTRGHNIVEDGWAGAFNPWPHPMPPTQIQQVAQGQYVVSDTHCPALSDCELE